MDIKNLAGFGKSLSSQDVASFLGVSLATVRSVAEDFGGILVGDEYVFFEAVFVHVLKKKIFEKQDSRAVVHHHQIDVADAVNDLQQLEDRHGIFAG